MEDKLIQDLNRIIQLLESQGLDASDYEAMKQEISTKPSQRIVDVYNELVENYNNASGFNQYNQAVNELLEFYNQHKEVLEDRATEMKALAEKQQFNIELNHAIRQFKADAEESGYYDV